MLEEDTPNCRSGYLEGRGQDFGGLSLFILNNSNHLNLLERIDYSLYGVGVGVGGQ